MKIAVIGSGYVGLVTGTCLAETGNHVTCVDIDEQKIQQLQNGVIPIYEPGLEQMFHRNVQHKRLGFTSSLGDGTEAAEVIFLALPTPTGENGSADLQHILDVALEIGPLLKDYVVIVDKSTVPVGTAEKVNQLISENTDADFDVVANPEFLREGVAVEDFMKPERVIVGTTSSVAKEVMEKIYAPFVHQGNPVLFMDVRSAELTKYAANAFLATKISYMNEIANVCELVGADIDSIRKGIGTDSRIGKRFLFAGIGYGGSCFPKDVLALTRDSQELGYDFKILNSVIKVNNSQKIKLVSKIREYFSQDLAGRTIGVWGLSFKPYTDDIREAPALAAINDLLDLGVKIKAYDPEAMQKYKDQHGDRIELCANEYESVKGADALFIATEWPEFRNPDFGKLADLLKQKVIFDGRNLYDIRSMEKLGFTYFSIGRYDVNVN